MPDHVMNYIECEAPSGLTLVERRRSRIAASSRRSRGYRGFLAGRRQPALAAKLVARSEF
jgi:hypothetical protein